MMARNLTKFGAAAAGFVAVFGLLNLLTPAAAEGSPLSDAPVVKALTAGGAHACGIFNESGVVYCWGDNSRGQLGVGDNVSRARPEVAVNLNGKKAVSVAAGFEHTCALTDDYYIYCWGAGTEEQLGFVNVDSNVPVFVSNVFDGITKLSAGFSTSCGIATTGAYVNQTICWGSNDEGQMGWQNIYSSPYLSGWWAVSDLAIGVSHSCGIISGAVKCSGAGGNGQLGNGLFSDSLTPVDVEGIVGEAVEVSAGYFMSCAASDNGFYCWGDDTSGQLGGDGVAGEATELMSWGAALPIASGYAHSCAGFWCIGENGSGQLGDGSTANRDEMTSVDLSGVLAGLSVKDVVAGFDFTCWVAGAAGSSLADGAFCSGAGGDGQLGDGLLTSSDVPVAVDLSEVEREIFINLEIDNADVKLTVVPNGGVAATGVELTVITNNLTGYELAVRADGATDLTCGSYAMPTQSADGAALEVNRWGWGVGASEPLVWNGVSLSDSSVASSLSASAVSGDAVRTWFGAKANFALPACSAYVGGVVFTATKQG